MNKCKKNSKHEKEALSYFTSNKPICFLFLMKIKLKEKVTWFTPWSFCRIQLVVSEVSLSLNTSSSNSGQTLYVFHSGLNNRTNCCSRISSVLRHQQSKSKTKEPTSRSTHSLMNMNSCSAAGIVSANSSCWKRERKILIFYSLFWLCKCMCVITVKMQRSNTSVSPVPASLWPSPDSLWFRDPSVRRARRAAVCWV